MFSGLPPTQLVLLGEPSRGALVDCILPVGSVAGSCPRQESTMITVTIASSNNCMLEIGHAGCTQVIELAEI